MVEDGVTLSVAELSEYCRTQAALLAGRVETISAETEELLSEIDDEIASLRSRTMAQANGPGSSPASPETPVSGDADDLTALEEAERDLEEKQAVAEAKQARMAAFRELSTAYVDLAEELDATAEDGQAALRRVVEFEQDHDAPAYFDEQLTVLEAVANSGE